MIFKTPARRVSAILSTIFLIVSASFYGYFIIDRVYWMTGAVFSITPDVRYLDEYSSEIGEYSGYIKCSGALCNWPTQKRMTRNFENSLSDVKRKLDQLSENNCPLIDKSFRPLRYEKKTWGGETPVQRMRSFYEDIEKVPSYRALENLNRYVDCYSKCDCSKYDAEFNIWMNYWDMHKKVISSKFSFDFFYPKIENSIQFVNYRYKIQYVLLLSILLILFSFGAFEPAFARIRKMFIRVCLWVKSGK